MNRKSEHFMYNFVCMTKKNYMIWRLKSNSWVWESLPAALLQGHAQCRWHLPMILLFSVPMICYNLFSTSPASRSLPFLILQAWRWLSERSLTFEVFNGNSHRQYTWSSQARHFPALCRFHSLVEIFVQFSMEFFFKYSGCMLFCHRRFMTVMGHRQRTSNLDRSSSPSEPKLVALGWPMIGGQLDDFGSQVMALDCLCHACKTWTEYS